MVETKFRQEVRSLYVGLAVTAMSVDCAKSCTSFDNKTVGLLVRLRWVTTLFWLLRKVTTLSGAMFSNL